MKGIPMKTWEVSAILDNRKMVARRVVKPQPVCHGPNITLAPHDDSFFLSKEKNWLRCRVCGHDPQYSYEGSDIAHHWTPPYRPGDILYVRETWNRAPFRYDEFIYKADGCYGPDMPWRPSIHMPSEAARIFLRVTDVHVERLQDINMNDIQAEGVVPGGVKGGQWQQWQTDYMKPVWDSTIKPKDRALYGWEANPWVWVIEFERVSKEEAKNG